jgi:hypothetical protein
MTRKIWSAALALSLAGGIYMAGSASASNMGFKLERDFDHLLNSATQRPLLNVYYVSLPNFNGMGDVADSSVAAGANPCVGDPGGPAAGDGEINSHDAVCDWWVARSNRLTAGSFQLITIDPSICTSFPVTGRFGVSGPTIQGTPFPPAGTDLWTDRGYQVNVGPSAPGNAPPRNRAVIVGSHDPSFAGQLLHFSTNCGTAAGRADFITVPYHTMYQEPVEILCGLRGLHWQDVDNNWRPDDTSPAGCAGGIFDGTITAQVIAAKNDDPSLGGVSGFVPQSARLSGFPPNQTVSIVPPDPPFHLIPGESYRVPLLLGQTDKIFLSPHF